MSTTSGSWTRIGDNSFGLGIKRFEDGDKNPLWRFQITHPHVTVAVTWTARRAISGRSFASARRQSRPSTQMAAASTKPLLRDRR